MERLLADLIAEMRKENHEDHHDIWQKLEHIERHQTSNEVFKARLLGIAAGISLAVSAGGWAIAHAFGG